MDWLSAQWWAGVQGVALVVGVLAIAIAVADFLIRMNLGAPPAMALTVRRVGAQLRDPRSLVDVTVTARPMGTHVLYEPRWRSWGDSDLLLLDELPPVLDVRDEPVSVTFQVDRKHLDQVKVGLEWVIPRRFGSYTAASRRGIGAMAPYERWTLYRWRRWPRRSIGYWKPNREAKKSNPLYGPE